MPEFGELQSFANFLKHRMINFVNVKHLVCFLGLLVTLIAVFAGCRKKEPLTFKCDSTIISFSDDISPIFEGSCYVGGAEIGCHSDWVFDWEGIQNVGYMEKNRERILDDCDMPPEDNDYNIHPLSDAELRMIYCWYEQGANDN